MNQAPNQSKSHKTSRQVNTSATGPIQAQAKESTVEPVKPRTYQILPKQTFESDKTSHQVNTSATGPIQAQVKESTMEPVKPRTYQILPKQTFKCDMCRRRAVIAEYWGEHPQWARCSRHAAEWLEFTTGISRALEMLAAQELEYAAHLVEHRSHTAECLVVAPYPEAGTDWDNYLVPEADYDHIPDDTWYLKWVPTGGTYFGPCDTCDGRTALIVGVIGDIPHPAVSKALCRECAMVEVEEGVNLSLAIMEIESPRDLPAAQAAADAARQAFGFAPVIVPRIASSQKDARSAA